VESDTYSLFAQAIWNINEAWEFTAGARYTDDDKEAEQGNVYVKSNDLGIPGLPGFGFDDILSPAGAVIKSDFDDTEVSPEATLTWRPDENITVWAAYKNGYKSGGFSTNTVLSAAATGPGLTFEPETAEGGEIGVKSTLMDGMLRLNATAYYYKFDDIQISVFDSATTSFSVDNAASATTTGVETLRISSLRSTASPPAVGTVQSSRGLLNLRISRMCSISAMKATRPKAAPMPTCERKTVRNTEPKPRCSNHR